jgi:ABC-2 type transport system ATP-binding protein
MKAIETKDISKSYGPVRALSKVSFEVGKGEVIGLLGPNGAGKTTLMKVLTGYLQPDAGTAMVAGVDVVADPLAAQKRIGYLPENAPLYGEMAVQEYLQMMAALRAVPADKQTRLISEAVYATGLEDYLTRPISKLSKGYRQRVGVAQAILHQPELLILDEPTTGLDPTQIAEIRELIRELAESSTVVLSTHILPEVEMTCDRVLVIMGGQLRTDANLAELRASNAAVVAVKEDTKNVRESLEKLAGVKQVEELDLDAEGYRRWRVSTAADANPCPDIFAVVRDQDWMISELRVAPRTLESVFRDLAEQPTPEAP